MGKKGGGGSGALDIEDLHFSDHLGSNVYSKSVLGGTNFHRVFEPFGRAIAGQTADYFAGHPYEAGTGLYYMKARWYDAESGRFASVDPVVDNKNDPQAYNGYSYVKNNPIGFVDPTGMAGCSPLGGVCWATSTGYPFFAAYSGGDPQEFDYVGDGNALEYLDTTLTLTGGERDSAFEAWTATADRPQGVGDDRLSFGHLISAGAFVGNYGVDAAAGAGIFFGDDAVGGTGFVAGAMNAGDIVSEGKTRGFELGFDHNILVTTKGFDRVPDLSTVSLSFGISIKFFFENRGRPLDLRSIRPNDLKGFSLGFGPGIGVSIVDSIGRGGSFPVLK
jgi:RHS repeat-associated protein